MKGAFSAPLSADTLLLLLFQLVFNSLRLIVLYQPQDVLVVHHALNEFSLWDFIWWKDEKQRKQNNINTCGWFWRYIYCRKVLKQLLKAVNESWFTVLLLPEEFPDFFRPLLRCVFILREVLLVISRNHVEYWLHESNFWTWFYRAFLIVS